MAGSRLKRVFLSAGLLSMAACSGLPHSYHSSEGAWSSKNGPGRLVVKAIRGQPATDRQCGKDVARLMPDTSYFRDWMSAIETKHRITSPPDREAVSQVRIGKNVVNCSFFFDHLPAGEWIFLGNAGHALDPEGHSIVLGTVQTPNTSDMLLRKIVRGQGGSMEGRTSIWSPHADEMDDITAYTILPHELEDR